MSGLVEFLRARYEERRAVALAATPGTWKAMTHRNRRTGETWGFEVLPVAALEGNGDGGVLTAADAKHIAAYGPDVVLADLDAKRRILDRHGPHSMGECRTCEAPHWGVQVCNHCERAWPCPDALDLAVPFAAHPDYDERWRT